MLLGAAYALSGNLISSFMWRQIAYAGFWLSMWGMKVACDRCSQSKPCEGTSASAHQHQLGTGLNRMTALGFTSKASQVRSFSSTLQKQVVPAATELQRTDPSTDAVLPVPQLVSF